MKRLVGFLVELGSDRLVGFFRRGNPDSGGYSVHPLTDEAVRFASVWVVIGRFARFTSVVLVGESVSDR